MAPANDEAAPDSATTTMQLDELFQRLKEHDPDWLAKTLYERWVQLVHDEKPLDQTRSVSNQSPIWPFDVTLPYTPEGLVMSEYVKFIRAYDWASTDLGPMSRWTLDLRRMVNMCLCDKRAAALWIGPKHIGFYNETYAEIAGQKHPHFLGKTFVEMWPEDGVADAFTELLSSGEKSGVSSKADDAIFVVQRNGYREEFWLSFTIVPVSDTAGGVFGCYNTVFDTTAKEEQARRLKMMLLLGQKTALATNVHDFWEAVIEGCSVNTHDIPFAALYSLVGCATNSHISSRPMNASRPYSEQEIRQWSFRGQIGLPDDFEGLPQSMNCLEATELLSSDFRKAMSSGKPLVLRKNDGTFPSILDGVARSRVYDDPCDTVVMFSISPTNKEDTFGFLLLGINPLGTYNSDYEEFIQLLLRQCATSLASVMLIEDEMRRAVMIAQDRSRLSAQLAETQKEVLDNETRFRTMADMAPVALFHLDEEGRVLYANKNWMELTGHPSDALGPIMSWVSVVHPEDLELVEREWSKLLSGTSVRFEMRWKRPFHPEVAEYFDGELIEGSTWTIASAYAEKRINGTVKGILGCLTDISRQKWMENFQDRRLKDLVELKRQQDNFMDLTSHEARNPLSAIMLCAESLITTFQELLQRPVQEVKLARSELEMQLDSAEIIMACAQHQKRIIDDVLTLSKLDSGLLVICPVEVQPIQSIAQALRMFDAEVHKHDIKLTFTIDESYHKLSINWVKLDPSRLLQVLINLLTNAIKFTQAESTRDITITLCAERERPVKSLNGVNYIGNDWPSLHVGEDNDVFIGLEVIDTGRGMTPDEMKRLFQKFQQASPKTHVEYGGSGLGLFISRQLTRLLGGAIGVASSGKGATFAFYMMASRCSAPATSTARKDSAIGASSERLSDEVSDTVVQRRPSANEAAIELVDPPAVSKIHVLIVEDNLVNQKVMRNQLERLNYAVTVANHGLEALDHLRQTRFCQEGGLPLDIVLMDVEMPVCNGLECARRIRAMERSSEVKDHVPIIGVTANARAEQQTAVMDAGMDSVVTKPFRLMELSAELEKMLNGVA